MSTPANFSNSSGGTVTSGQLNINHCRLRSLYATNANSAPRWLLLYDLGRVPNSGDAPSMQFLLQPGSAANPTEKLIGHELLGDEGVGGFRNGCSWAISGTLTAYDGTATASDHAMTLVGSNN